MDFKDRLQKCMTYRQISQVELSRRTEISRSSICLYLKGERIPKTDQIGRLAMVLDVSPTYLLGLTDQMITNEYKVHQHITGEQTEDELLLDELRANITWLNTEELRMMNAMVKTLIKDRK